MLYFMGINFQLVTIYLGLLAVALIYGYVWQELYERTKRSSLFIDGSFLEALHLPFYFMLILYAIKSSIPYIPSWFFTEFSVTPDSFKPFFPIGFTILALWILNNTLSNIQEHIVAVEKNEEVPNSAAWISACKFGRVILAIIFALMIMYHLKIPMGQFLAPTAVGALAISFASKDVLSNVFGGLMVMCDRPFSEGDYVTIANHDEGTVRYIGWRVTEIQLRNGRILTVPNGIITNSVVTNYSKKTHWFVQKEFGIRYDDFEVSPKIAEELTIWIKEHPQVNRRRVSFAHVFSLDDSSVTIRVRVYLKSSLNTKQWYEFTEELLMEINKTVKKHKADFAFPTRIVLMEKK